MTSDVIEKLLLLNFCATLSYSLIFTDFATWKLINCKCILSDIILIRFNILFLYIPANAIQLLLQQNVEITLAKPPLFMHALVYLKALSYLIIDQIGSIRVTWPAKAK